MKIGEAIRRNSLQALEQHRAGHEGSPDHDRRGERGDIRSIASEVVDLPPESGAWYPFPGAKRGEHEQQRAATLHTFVKALIDILSYPCSAKTIVGYHRQTAVSGRLGQLAERGGGPWSLTVLTVLTVFSKLHSSR